MHITEGVLTGPSVIITNVVGGAVILWGVRAMSAFTKEQPSRKPLLGMAGAFIFFVSLIHLPAFGGLTCSHPCGTPLAGILLGPGVAAGLAACGLLLQALFFAHGGLSTLGANTITLGLMGAGSGWLFSVASRARLRISICMKITGIQNAPATANSKSEVASQPSEGLVEDSIISTPPVIGCAITAVSVNSMSAMTTTEAVRAMKAAEPLRCAISMKKAMPPPVPRMTMAPSTCRYLMMK